MYSLYPEVPGPAGQCIESTDSLGREYWTMSHPHRLRQLQCQRRSFVCRHIKQHLLHLLSIHTAESMHPVLNRDEFIFNYISDYSWHATVSRKQTVFALNSTGLPERLKSEHVRKTQLSFQTVYKLCRNRWRGWRCWLVGSGLTALLAQKGYIVPRILQNWWYRLTSLINEIRDFGGITWRY